jgi:hypothetical protein
VTQNDDDDDDDDDDEEESKFSESYLRDTLVDLTLCDLFALLRHRPSGLLYSLANLLGPFFTLSCVF